MPPSKRLIRDRTSAHTDYPRPQQCSCHANMAIAKKKLYESRPTAVNLCWALDEVDKAVAKLSPADRGSACYALASRICDDDVSICESIGEHGREFIADIGEKKNADVANPVNILTHCNVGWLATVDWGTALAPVYKAHDVGIPVHVWVDETRPRNQAAANDDDIVLWCAHRIRRCALISGV